MKALDFKSPTRFLNRPYLLFSPFLVLYLVTVAFFNNPDFVGDEQVYVNYAQNILNIFNTTSNFYLGVGPGYPSFLLPFVALKLPVIFLTLLNAILYYFSIVLVYITISRLTNSNIAFWFSIFWGFYINSFEYMLLILPETFTLFLISLFIYLLVKGFEKQVKSNKMLIYSGLILGFLALTKIIFGYVIFVLLFANGILWLLHRSELNYQKSLRVLSIAALITIPYLGFTYHLTGRLFYWGSTAGNNMYWMSTPYEGEYGSWFADPVFKNDTSNQQTTESEIRNRDLVAIKNNSEYIPGTQNFLVINHRRDLEKILKLDLLQQDSALQKLAMRNIRNHPIKFFKNCLANVGRMLFNFPYSYTPQRSGTLLRLPFSGVLVVLLVFSLIPALLNWKRLSYSLRFLILMFVVYFGGSITGSAEARMFTVIVPILLVWISYILVNSVKIKLKFD